MKMRWIGVVKDDGNVIGRIGPPEQHNSINIAEPISGKSATGAATQNLSLKKDVADLREHLDALDAQLNQSKIAPSPQTSPEDKW
jgi:hypothetical protein